MLHTQYIVSKKWRKYNSPAANSLLPFVLMVKTPSISPKADGKLTNDTDISR